MMSCVVGGSSEMSVASESSSSLIWEPTMADHAQCLSTALLKMGARSQVCMINRRERAG